jgi:hypothetical protein
MIRVKSLIPALCAVWIASAVLPSEAYAGC